MREFKTEKKTDGQTYNRTKSDQDSVRYRQKTEPDFVGSGFHPPERFVPLLAKFSHPANATQRVQLFSQLQRHYGNRYVQRVVSAYRSQNVEEEESKLAFGIVTKKGSGRPLEPGNLTVQRLSKSGAIQAKLRIGQPNDIYEQEADRVAEEVMRMPEPQVQRQPEEEEELLQTKPLAGWITHLVQRQGEEEEEEEIFRTKEVPGQIPEVTPDLESRITTMRSSGKPLPESIRTFFEPRFGYDFSQVRVHTDTRAAESARAMNARALTVGRNIVFGAGQYAPGTSAGRRLLAHELTHAIQQSSQRNMQGALLIGPANTYYEREADHITERVMQDRAVEKPSQTKVVCLQRKPDVGFVVHDLRRDRGQLDDPAQDTPVGSVSWPLSFGVTSPLEAEADVEVTGSPGDPCTSHQIGFLQTVDIHWLRAYYSGQSTGHGSVVVRYTVPLPIRDGALGTMWYSSTAQATPAACNVHVNPGMDDYPTIFMLPKVRTNSLTGQPNYLDGVSRGIFFVTTLVASGPTGVQPLRFFRWYYLMGIEFQPHYTAPNAVWPFAWNKNTADFGIVQTGTHSIVPIFTTATTPFNHALTENVDERR